ncbi:MAG TPA: VOC family protein [Nocardiopsis listeri]|uniref:VOC family protein n=1 Tax=Nocardiopsis listeri TaxID=53440 RepID=UPI001D4F458A|nr:VOC family protein [Nocardiopsis listeri]HJE60579.1 VOC family protein [Nocardiopsis listeri]
MTTPAGLLVLSLPIADRMSAMVFYRDAFGFELLGEPAEDGVPEPLQLRLNDQALLMLVPTGGFGWVVGGDREIARPGTSECLLSMAVPTEDQVAQVMDRVTRAGGEVITPPQDHPWGHSAVCADLDGHLWQIIVEPTGP